MPRSCWKATSTPDEAHAEGPFGEWTGHYAGGVRDLPVLDIKAIYHRNDPILLGVPPMGGGPDEMARYRAVMRSATIKQNIDQCRRARRARRCGATRSAARACSTRVSITQRYPGHAVQAAHIAAQCGASAYASKYIVVVRRRRRRHQSRSSAVGDAHPHRPEGVDPVHQGLVGFAAPTRALPPETRARPAT